MKLQSNILLSIAYTFILSVVAVNGSGQTVSSTSDLFESNEVFTISLKGNVRGLLNDRVGTAKSFPFTLSYYNKDSAGVAIPVEVRTRGHFRRMNENCNYPPMQIEFSNAGVHLSTVFKEQKKLKLVMPCKSADYIIREWLVYKIYNLITPASFRARLVKVKLEDSNNKKTSPEFFGLLLEEENQMAKRNRAEEVEKKLTPQQTRGKEFLNMSVFQYLVGN